MGQAKTQISLGIRPVWSESSLSVQSVAKDPSFPHADSEDSDQTGRMPRQICLCCGHTHFVGFVMLQLKCATKPSNRKRGSENKMALSNRCKYLALQFLSQYIVVLYQSLCIHKMKRSAACIGFSEKSTFPFKMSNEKHLQPWDTRSH